MKIFFSTMIVYLNEYIVRAIYFQSSVNVATFQNILRKQNKVFFVGSTTWMNYMIILLIKFLCRKRHLRAGGKDKKNEIP